MTNHIGHVQHIGISTVDQRQTLAFFEDMGFLRFYEAINPETAVTVVFIQLGDIVLEVYPQPDAAPSPGVINHIAVSVDDVDEKYAQICSVGYEVVEDGVQQLPFWENGVRYFTVAGPCGERVEFCQLL